ncbi:MULTISPECIES: NAD(P)/FAD-dependent oxidoreductase [Agrobacterium]|uniref:FAD/NAD(P)-dependent oxidoreductase n=1 Tax=Agrobacterium TaxID=357 RepID=UPI00081001DC|nr:MULTISPECIES: NAD(P)/FAD-dependent oxidoreductase [Agrobacterium]NSL21059.1 FAD-dependent oxidoreductase [Agrobacterium tumefaciens]NSZ00701.1 FAD-dependent oxidoreductase [Agrobacterium tumefaciens]NSZ09920.1 FAD-dependent oxidoreductase [Agrobacterium tumefaciens]NSZ39624.1 FAD-dependent oxidoreductase [Agrobacterium tumefaciens]NTB05610.1 FAD-dependent oxidoreductase [Agrobacterium tumefaciens]
MNHHSSADLLIVGAGPAGMAAARRAVRGGLSVILLDSQSQPGGQIWRNAGRNATSPIINVLGAEYRRGVRQVEAFLACGADYIPDAQVNRLSQGWTVEYVWGGEIRSVRGRHLLLATGAQERPVPFTGWTLPGVMTVGAAQILLKTAGQLPRGPVAVIGSGPLPLLYMQQMRLAGSKPVAYLDTTPRGLISRSLRGFRGALQEPGQILKGIAWLPQFSGVRHVRNVVKISAKGSGRLETVRFETSNGRSDRLEVKSLLVHEGLVPSHQLAVSVGAQLMWDVGQSAFRLERDEWMNAGPDGLYIAGDGARIGGAVNAEIEGEIAAIGVLLRDGALTAAQADTEAKPLRAQHGRQKSFRRFLDGAYPPNIARTPPDDETIVCRCEELSAGMLREAAVRAACRGPNQLKSFTRAGMGPCQGRQCGYPVHELVKSVAGLTAGEVGLFNPRPPFVPLTVSMLAAQQAEEVISASTHE